MTQEEKARAYDEALKQARKQKYDYQKELNKTDKNSQLAGLLRAGISALEMAFPQLRESEEERTRKAIIATIEQCPDDFLNPKNRDRMLAWLEEQKEEEGYEAIPIENTLEYKAGFHAGREFEKQKEQKPAWSEEDDRKRNGLIEGLERRMGFGWASDPFSREEYIDWLKSLRPSWKPSEEQMEALEECGECKRCIKELYEQLKRIKED